MEEFKDALRAYLRGDDIAGNEQCIKQIVLTWMSDLDIRTNVNDSLPDRYKVIGDILREAAYTHTPLDLGIYTVTHNWKALMDSIGTRNPVMEELIFWPMLHSLSPVMTGLSGYAMCRYADYVLVAPDRFIITGGVGYSRSLGRGMTDPVVRLW